MVSFTLNSKPVNLHELAVLLSAGQLLDGDGFGGGKGSRPQNADFGRLDNWRKFAAAGLALNFHPLTRLQGRVRRTVPMRP